MRDRSADIIPHDVPGNLEQTWFDAKLFDLISQYDPQSIEARTEQIITESERQS